MQANFDERGLLGLAFHPDYAENGRFYVFYSAPLRAGAPAGTIAFGPDGTLLAATTRKKGLWRIQELRVHRSPGGRLGHFILGFGRDSRGEMYVLTSDSIGPQGTTGKVFRLVRSGRRVAKGQ